MSNYMAWLPYPVRHARNVSPGAKLLYAELTTFTDKQARTRVKNSELCEVLEAGERSIIRWLNELKSAQFIAIFLNGPERIITLSMGRNVTPPKLATNPAKNGDLTLPKLATNTLYTSFSNEKVGTKELSTEEVQQQPEKPRMVPPTLDEVIKHAECNGIPKITAEKFWNYFQACGWEVKAGVAMRSWTHMLRTWKVSDDSRQDEKRQREQVSAILNKPAVTLVPVNSAKSEDLDRIDAAYRVLEVGGAQ